MLPRPATPVFFQGEFVCFLQRRDDEQDYQNKTRVVKPHFSPSLPYDPMAVKAGVKGIEHRTGAWTSTQTIGSDSASLLGGVAFRVHRPDDDDLLQTLGRGGRWPQLLHQGVEGVRVDGLLLVAIEGHLVGGGDGQVDGLRLQALDDGGSHVDRLGGGGDLRG